MQRYLPPQPRSPAEGDEQRNPHPQHTKKKAGAPGSPSCKYLAMTKNPSGLPQHQVVAKSNEIHRGAAWKFPKALLFHARDTPQHKALTPARGLSSPGGHGLALPLARDSKPGAHTAGLQGPHCQGWQSSGWGSRG